MQSNIRPRQMSARRSEVERQCRNARPDPDLAAMRTRGSAGKKTGRRSSRVFTCRPERGQRNALLLTPEARLRSRPARYDLSGWLELDCALHTGGPRQFFRHAHESQRDLRRRGSAGGTSTIHPCHPRRAAGRSESRRQRTIAWNAAAGACHRVSRIGSHPRARGKTIFPGTSNCHTNPVRTRADIRPRRHEEDLQNRWRDAASGVPASQPLAHSALLQYQVHHRA